jgi:hypothetical protein
LLQHCEDKGMNRDERTRPDDTLADANSAPTKSTDVNAGSAADDAPSPFARIDELAVSSLSGKALARYYAYKEVLLAREQDEAAIASTLILFISDLSESR